MIEFISGIKSKISDKKILRLLILSAAAALILIVSEFQAEAPKTENDFFAVSEYSEEYVECMQKQLQKILEGIDGAGDVDVMLTLENYYENVYAKSYEGQNSNSEKENESSTKETFVTIKNGSNTEECLIVKIYEPQIKGVAVVCSGGDNPSVKKAVTEAVCALFDISSAKVSVTKKSD